MEERSFLFRGGSGSGGLGGAFGGGGFLTPLHLIRFRLFIDHALHATLLKADGLPDAVTEEVKFGATDDGGPDDLDLSDLRGMEGEFSFDPFTGDDPADGEHLTASATTTGDHDAIEDLDSFFPAFENFAMNVDRVTDLKFGDVLFFPERFNLTKNFLTHDKPQTLSLLSVMVDRFSSTHPWKERVKNSRQ